MELADFLKLPSLILHGLDSAKLQAIDKFSSFSLHQICDVRLSTGSFLLLISKGIEKRQLPYSHLSAQACEGMQ